MYKDSIWENNGQLDQDNRLAMSGYFMHFYNHSA